MPGAAAKMIAALEKKGQDEGQELDAAAPGSANRAKIMHLKVDLKGIGITKREKELVKNEVFYRHRIDNRLPC